MNTHSDSMKPQLRRDAPDETQQAFYGRILAVMAQLGGGSANVL